MRGVWQLKGHCLQTGYADDGNLKRVAKSFRQREPDPKAGKAAGSGCNSKTFNVFLFEPGGMEEHIKGRHEIAKVPLSARHQLLRYKRAILMQQGDTALLGRGVQGKNHCILRNPQNSRDIVIDDNRHEQHEKANAQFLRKFTLFNIQGPSHDQFNQKKDNEAAIQNRHGKKVQDT